MRFTIAVYQVKRGPYLVWTTLGLGPLTRTRSATLPAKVEQLLAGDLRELVRTGPTAALGWLQPRRGLRLERVRVDLPLTRHGGERSFSGEIPLVVEQRAFTRSQAVTIAYHPARQAEWFPVPEGRSLVEAGTPVLSRAWAGLSGDALDALRTNRKDLIRPLAFSASPRSLLDELRAHERGVWDDLRADPTRSGKRDKRKLELLPSLGEDLTSSLLGLEPSPGDELPAALGLSRAPTRQQLGELLAGGARLGEKGRAAGSRRPSVFLVGPPGCGKTTAYLQWAWDLARAEGWGVHRNADLLTRVYRVSGKRLLAGMSFVGDWEQRVVELLAELRGRGIVLHVPDLTHFGRLGRAKGSDRALADLFRGAVAREEVTLLAEGTSEQLARLGEDAPAFAGLFVRVPVAEPAPDEAFRMLLASARAAELESGVRVAPLALRSLLELSSSFASASALPRRALELFRHVLHHEDARRAASPDAPHPPLEPADVARALSEQLGVPRALLDRGAVLDRADVERALAEQVIGQPEATAVAADVVVRIKAGLADPRRPFGVLLFAGPTGTGKTELAKCLAEYLFGSSSRLIRFDMSELSSPDAPARLVGDTWSPEGALVRAVREQPLAVVLLDEIEKAHASVHALLLQLFEDGRLTDAAGTTAAFQGTVVIMTSNLGARRREPIGLGPGDGGAATSDAVRAAKEFFAPELFNRIDHVVAFRPLAPAVAVEVAEKELEKLRSRRGLEMRDVFVEVGRSVVERLAREALVARDGARSLKRLLEDRIAAPLAELVAGSPAAVMRMLYLFEAPSGEGFVIRDEPLTEAPLLADAAAGAPDLEELGAEPLRQRLEGRAPALAALRERCRASLEATPPDAAERYVREALLGRVEELEEEVTEMLAARPVRRADAPEEEPRWTESISRRGGDYTRSRTRLGGPAQVRRATGREALLGAFVLSHHLERLAGLGPLEAASGEVAVVELLRVAAPKAPRLQELAAASHDPAGGTTLRRATLVDWLARAYLAFARELGRDAPGGAASLRGGVVRELATEADLGRELAARPELVVLKLSALGLREALGGEVGCHVWQPLGLGPEIVRVRVVSTGAAPAAVVRDFVARREAFQRALGVGGAPAGPLPENPAALAPIVRSLRFDPPAREGKVAPLELEDYPLGLALEVHAADPATIFARLLRRRCALVAGGGGGSVS